MILSLRLDVVPFLALPEVEQASRNKKNSSGCKLTASERKNANWHITAVMITHLRESHEEE
jgi:hypothetical protein